MSNFTPKDETQAADKQKRKRYDILPHLKMIYTDIGYQSASLKSGKWWKDTKDKEATLI